MGSRYEDMEAGGSRKVLVLGADARLYGIQHRKLITFLPFESQPHRLNKPFVFVWILGAVLRHLHT